MVAAVESVHSWVENITYQMCNMSYMEQADKLAGPIALCKYQVNWITTECDDSLHLIY